MNFLMIGLTAHGKGISGCDRISIEFSKRWAKEHQVSICVWEEGLTMYKKQHLSERDVKFKVLKMKFWTQFGFVINYFAVILAGMIFALTLKLKNNKETVVYSASEFWMDSLPGLILKLRFPEIIWVATWFQTAPNPLVGFREGGRVMRYRFSAFLYWLVQLPIKPLIARFADFVLVNNESERIQFPAMDKKKKVIVVLGAVDLPLTESMKKRFKNEKKIYDAVFQGRFHPQKGVVELIEIWKRVVDEKPDAKLALIGDGPLMNQVKEKIADLNMQKNVKLFGYLFDGVKKYQVFAQSRVVVHPAFYDSGGMASAEAMALGLPAVGFDLISYESYYPKGLIKVPVNDLSSFATTILELLKNKPLYLKMATEAEEMIYKNWSWDKRAEEVLGYLK